MLKIGLSTIAVAVAVWSTPAFAEEGFGQAWVDVMNACEVLVSEQSFRGFQEHSEAPSTLNVEPQLERGFQHHDFPLNASAITDGSEWFLCVVTGETGENQGSVIGTVTGTLLAQIRDQGNLSMIFDDGKTLAPVRIICRGGGQLTSVFAYYGDENELRVAAVNRLPNGTDNPCK
ncbi:MAG: hypothetical protein OXC60_14935 [Litoreibacter sp.]|nr:hypothetical protein [Litoreibacter sp.]